SADHGHLARHPAHSPSFVPVPTLCLLWRPALGPKPFATKASGEPGRVCRRGIVRGMPRVPGLRSSDSPRGHRIAKWDRTNDRLHRISTTKYCHEKLGVAAAGLTISPTVARISKIARKTATEGVGREMGGSGVLSGVRVIELASWTYVP